MLYFYENAHSWAKMFQNKFSSNISTKIDRNTIIGNIEIIESIDKDFGYFFTMKHSCFIPVTTLHCR